MELPDLATIHDRYLALACADPHHGAVPFAGKLLLRTELDAEGIAVIVAASVARAASLCIDAEAESLRHGLRAGFCDFVVSHLDEALRILKNELRQGRAVAVGLTADPEACLTAIVDRGLQPDFLSLASRRSQMADILLERGSRLVRTDAPDSHTSMVGWSVTTEPARSLRAIAGIAAGVLDPSRVDTPARSHWLDLSPAWLGRALGPRQCVRLTPQELAAFLPSLWSHFPNAAVTRDGEEMLRS